MAVCEIHFGSDNALNKMTSAMVILPEGKPGPFPVFYLLHGLSDDHTVWTRRTSIERYVEGLPLIVVMPNGERSFYTNSKSNPLAAFETNLVQDLIGFIDNTFQTISDRSGRVIAGLSMGGYGAIKIALKHPDLFCASASHSGALSFASQPFSTDDEWSREWIPIFGKKPKESSENIFALAEGIDRDQIPALRIDCGVNDFLIEDNRRMHKHLDKLGISHEYHEFSGEHTWGYWDRHIQETISFFVNSLKLQN